MVEVQAKEEEPNLQVVGVRSRDLQAVGSGRHLTEHSLSKKPAAIKQHTDFSKSCYKQ